MATAASSGCWGPGLALHAPGSGRREAGSFWEGDASLGVFLDLPEAQTALPDCVSTLPIPRGPHSRGMLPCWSPGTAVPPPPPRAPTWRTHGTSGLTSALEQMTRHCQPVLTGSETRPLRSGRSGGALVAGPLHHPWPGYSLGHLACPSLGHWTHGE